MTENSDADSRQGGRARVLLKGKLRLADGDLPCRISDLSATGARILTDVPLKEGDIVGLTVAAHGEFPAAIVRVDGLQSGLQFIDGAEGGLRRLGEKAELLGVKP